MLNQLPNSINVPVLFLRYGSVLILDCEVSPGNVIIVFLSVINGSFAVGNALPKLQAFAAALGSAMVIFEIINRVQKLHNSKLNVCYNFLGILEASD